MAYETEQKEYLTVGRAEQQKYNAPHIKEGTFKVTNAGELIADVLTLVDGDFKALVEVVETAVNSYLRYKHVPGATEEAKIAKVLAFMEKNGLTLDKLVG